MTQPKVLNSDKRDPKAEAIFKERGIDVDAAFLEDRFGFGVPLVAVEDFGLGHFDSFQKLRSS